MRLPSSSGWKMAMNGIGVPPPKPGTDQWRDDIKARRAQLTADKRLDPTWTANNDDWWKTYFKAKYDVEMHITHGLVGGPNSWNKDSRALFWGVPGRTLENVIRGIRNGAPRLETPSSPPPSPRGGPTQWQPRRTTYSSSSNSSSSGPARSTPSSSYRSAPYSVPKREVKEEPATPINTRRGGSGSRRQQERRGGALLIPKPESKLPETSQYAATIAKLRLGTRNSVLALRRDGELEEIIAIITTDASPSTSHVSPIHTVAIPYTCGSSEPEEAAQAALLAEYERQQQLIASSDDPEDCPGLRAAFLASLNDKDAWRGDVETAIAMSIRDSGKPLVDLTDDGEAGPSGLVKDEPVPERVKQEMGLDLNVRLEEEEDRGMYLDLNIIPEEEEHVVHPDHIPEEEEEERHRTTLPESHRFAAYIALKALGKYKPIEKVDKELVAQLLKTSLRTVEKAWKKALDQEAKNEEPDFSNKRKGRCGRKRKALNLSERVPQVALNKRGTLRALARSLDIPYSTLQRRLTWGELRRHTSSLKPFQSVENKIKRLKFCISMIDETKQNLSEEDDRFVWKLTPNGLFTVKSINPSKEIFSELDEINAQGPIFTRSFQKTEEKTKWGHEAAPQQGGAAQELATRP
ncbi:hypothetical protein QYE76_029280 [Lolium multiflorum]|uniref:Uncharacterized protein n=1 Tax=Lolium multiflorum TaxID=4521 RepID=A0AAD8QQ60_LOLMU|nr:hypothetical protein QYE76_029280 [Lolium multiflorum]